MNLTLSDYADLIIANVYGGLKGIANFSLSKEAVETEFVLGSRRIIKDLKKAEQFEPEEFFQTIPKLELKPLTEDNEVPFMLNPDGKKGKIFFTTIPKLLWVTGIDPVDYAGPFNVFKQYVVKKGNSFINYQYSKYHSKEPSVWVKDQTLYVINNMPNVKFLQLRALFENPTDLLKDGDPFPIPSNAGDILLTKMAEQYIRFYRLQGVQPNTQNDLLSQTQNRNEE